MARTACGNARAVARLTAARWQLAGGKVLPASTGGVPGRRQARRVETGFTEAVGRRWSGGKWLVRRFFNGGGVALVVIDVCGGGPAAPVRKGEDGVCSNLGMTKLGGRSPERGKTAAVLGKI
jgi:hypothetical protein